MSGGLAICHTMNEVAAARKLRFSWQAGLLRGPAEQGDPPALLVGVQALARKPGE
jgi:hypothetical protein